MVIKHYDCDMERLRESIDGYLVHARDFNTLYTKHVQTINGVKYLRASLKFQKLSRTQIINILEDILSLNKG